MMNNLSNKYKFFGLIAAAVLGLLLAWFMAWSNTFEVMAKCATEEAEIEKAQTADVRLIGLKREVAQLDALFGTASKASSYQHELFDVISNYCTKKGLIIKSFPAPVVNSRSGFEVETSSITIEGNFKPMLDLVYLLETKEKVGKIASVDFQVREDFKRQQKVLEMTLFVQFAQKAKS